MVPRKQAAARDALEHAFHGQRLRARQCLLIGSQRDRADVAALAGGPGLDIDVLRARYVEELRPKLGRPEREDLTLELWIEIIEETRQGRMG